MIEENASKLWKIIQEAGDYLQEDFRVGCIGKGATIGGNKGSRFKKPFLKFWQENLLN